MSWQARTGAAGIGFKVITLLEYTPIIFFYIIMHHFDSIVTGKYRLSESTLGSKKYTNYHALIFEYSRLVAYL